MMGFLDPIAGFDDIDLADRPGQVPEPEPSPQGLDITHDTLALEMGRGWSDARHVALWGSWMFWTGARWQRDERLLHLTRTREFLRAKGDEHVRWARRQNDPKLVDACEEIAKRLRAAPMVANVVGLARSNPTQAASADQWDADAYRLGTPAAKERA